MLVKPFIAFWVMFFCLSTTAEATPTDIIVWTKAGTGYISQWITVEGSIVKTIAKRHEAVISDGKSLWALRTRETMQELEPCDSPLDEAEKPKAEFEKAIVFYSVDLISGAETPISTASDEIVLRGGVGDLISFENPKPEPKCLRCGYGDCWTGVNHENKLFQHSKLDNNPSDSDIYDVDSPAATKAKEELLDQAKKCLGDDVQDDDPELSTDTLSTAALYFSLIGGEWVTRVALYYTAGIRAFDACSSLGTPFSISQTQLAAHLQPTQAVKQALKALKDSDAVGYSILKLSGKARKHALRQFKQTKRPAKSKSKSKAKN